MDEHLTKNLSGNDSGSHVSEIHHPSSRQHSSYGYRSCEDLYLQMLWDDADKYLDERQILDYFEKVRGVLVNLYSINIYLHPNSCYVDI